jgi:hypothetical protein
MDPFKIGKNQENRLMSFEKSVFINCPFDEEYKPLLKTLLYTLKKLDFIPRISLERNDSGEIRLNKIKELIESSKFGIHDLSRAKASSANEYYRQNMPFELGLDLGCRDYHSDPKFRSKKILILEQEKYSTQKALSDLSFADCKCHNGEAEEIVYLTRTWFEENGISIIKSASSLWDDYNIFYAELYDYKIKKGFKTKDLDRISIAEFLKYIDEIK